MAYECGHDSSPSYDYAQEALCPARHHLTVDPRTPIALGLQRVEYLEQVAEVILDLANADDLETEFQLKNIINADKAAVAELIDNPLCHFGASDAGAHITQFCGSGDTTHMLEHYVREAKQIPLERAVHRMTEEVARDWGLHDRGTLAPGKAADVVIFDLETVAISEQCFVDDFPGEASRYLRKAVGYDVVIVNGEPVLEAGVYTQARPGKVI